MAGTATVLAQSTPGWQIALEVASAVGTIAAAGVAAWAAKGAQAIARQDRRAAIEREQDERRYDRDREGKQHRLQLALTALTALESWHIIPTNHTAERGQALGELSGALMAMEDDVRFCRGMFVDGMPSPTDQQEEIEQRFGLSPEMQSPIEIGRRELGAVIAEIRRDLRAV